MSIKSKAIDHIPAIIAMRQKLVECAVDILKQALEQLNPPNSIAIDHIPAIIAMRQKPVGFPLDILRTLMEEKAMTIDSIRNGIVIDHIPAGRAMLLYRHLNLEQVECSVAILKNVTSAKLGRKDIIKIDEVIELNWDTLGFLAPSCTVSIIRDGVNSEKRKLDLPERIHNVIRCKNPRCITTIEQELEPIFKLTNRKTSTYRCIYCEAKA